MAAAQHGCAQALSRPLGARCPPPPQLPVCAACRPATIVVLVPRTAAALTSCCRSPSLWLEYRCQDPHRRRGSRWCALGAPFGQWRSSALPVRLGAFACLCWMGRGTTRGGGCCCLVVPFRPSCLRARLLRATWRVWRLWSHRSPSVTPPVCAPCTHGDAPAHRLRMCPCSCLTKSPTHLIVHSRFLLRPLLFRSYLFAAAQRSCRTSVATRRPTARRDQRVMTSSTGKRPSWVRYVSRRRHGSVCVCAHCAHCAVTRPAQPCPWCFRAFRLGVHTEAACGVPMVYWNTDMHAPRTDAYPCCPFAFFFPSPLCCCSRTRRIPAVCTF